MDRPGRRGGPHARIAESRLRSKYPNIGFGDFLLQLEAGYDILHPSLPKRTGNNEMVKIRMRRTGCKNHAAFRIVAADERSPRDGKFLEILGWYDTALKENNFKLDIERVDYWLSKGAKPSETVASLIRRAKNPALKPHHAVKAKAPAKKEAAPAA